MSQTAIAQEKAFKLPMEPVDIYKMKQSPKGYLSLKAVLSDPQGEPTDLLDFHPSGDYLVSGGDTHTNIRIWDLKTEKAIKTLDKQIASDNVMFTPDGKYLFVDYYLSPDDEKQYKTPYKVLYDTKSYEVSHLDELKNGGKPGIAVFNPVSDELFIINGRTVSKVKYPNIRKYAITDQGFKALSASESQVYGLRDALAWSPDGRYLAVGVTDHGEKGVQDNTQFIGIWDANSLKEVRRIENIYEPPNEYIIKVNALAWSPDGNYLVVGPSGSHETKVRNMKTKEMMVFDNLEIPMQVRNAGSGEKLYEITAHRPGLGISHIEFLSEDMFVTLERASRSGAHLVLWSVLTGEMLESFKLPKTHSIPSLAWHAPSQTLAVSFGRIIQIFNLNTNVLK